MNDTRNIKLVLEYDGSAFFGFQKQPHHPTVQEALEKALSRLLNQKTKIKAASGRTDTGVHAAHQVVNFHTASDMSTAQMQKGLNALLPRSIAVKEVVSMPMRYHARYDVRHKTYQYQIWNHPIRSPLNAAFTLHITEKLNIRHMRDGARLLTGRHDFRAFCCANGKRAEEKKRRGTVRTIHRVDIRKRGHMLTIGIQADGFLYRMARNLVGALLDLGRGKIRVVELAAILKSKDRKRAGAAAPARGLSLVDVTY